VRRGHELLGFGLRDPADRRSEARDQSEAAGLARPNPDVGTDLSRRPVCRATNSTALQKQAA
jgi:hypothetical protein